MHPVHIAAKGIDLAVMRNVAIGVRTLPTGKCVRRKPLMDQAQCASYIWIGELAVEICNLVREQQPFVDNRSARERGDVKHLSILDAGYANFVFSALAHDIKLALEGIFIQARRAANKHLLDIGLRGPRDSSNGRGIDRRIAPAEQGKTFFPDDPLEKSFGLQTLLLLYRQEGHAYAVGAGFRKAESKIGRASCRER